MTFPSGRCEGILIAARKSGLQLKDFGMPLVQRDNIKDIVNGLKELENCRLSTRRSKEKGRQSIVNNDFVCIVFSNCFNDGQESVISPICETVRSRSKTNAELIKSILSEEVYLNSGQEQGEDQESDVRFKRILLIRSYSKKVS